MSTLLPNFDSKKPAKNQVKPKTPAKNPTKPPAKPPKTPTNTPVGKPKTWKVKCGLCSYYVMFPSSESRMKYASHVLKCGMNDHCGASNAPPHARPRSSPPATIRFKKDLEEKILLPKNWRKLPTKQLKEFLRKQGMSGLSSDEEVEYFRLQGSSTGRSSLIQEDPAHQNGLTRRTPSPVEIEHFVKEMRIQGQMEERSEPQRSQLARIRLQNSLLSPELLRIEEERRRRLEEASGTQRQRLGSLQLQTEDAGTQIRNELRRRATSFQEVYSNSINQDSGKSLQELYEEAVRNEKELKERLNQNGGRSFEELYEEAKKQKEEKEKVKRNRPGQ